MHTAERPSLLPIPFSRDSRGVFSKPFHQGQDQASSFPIAELFWTQSSRGSIRGLHFQTPPYAVQKLVWVSHGSVLDVVVDMRRHERYGEVTSFALEASAGTALWIPAGFAHGFQALKDDSIINYAVDARYAPEHDTGVLWDSIDFEWPLPAGTMSERDLGFVRLDEYNSPFEFGADA